MEPVQQVEPGLNDKPWPGYNGTYHSGWTKTDVDAKTEVTFTTEPNVGPSDALPAGSIPERDAYQQTNPLLWAPEILSLVFGVAILIVIVVLLAQADGTTTSQWPLAITLNTLLALLAALSRMAFMYPIIEGLAQLKWPWYMRESKPLIDFGAFDEASRGPLGCLRLLFRYRGILAVTGAVVSISGLLTSTVSQQAVVLEQHPAVAHDGLATVSRATSYSLYHDGDYILGPYELISAKRAMMDGGLYPPNASYPDSTPKCSSGNCQWEPYGSLAVCSSTVNLTAMGNTTLLDSLMAMAHTRVVALYNGSSLLMKEGLLFNGFLSTIPPTFPVLVGTMNNPSGIFNDDVYKAMFSNHFIAYTNEPLTTDSVSNATFYFLEAAFWLCTKSYNTTVCDGAANTTELGTKTEVLSPEPHKLNYAWAPDFEACYMMNNCNETLGNSSLELAAPPGVTSREPYTVNLFTVLIASVLTSLTMYDSLLMDENRGVVTATGGGIAQAFASSLFGDFYSTQNPPEADQMANVRGVVSNIARALTNHVREGDIRLTGDGARTASVSGTIFTPETFVRIYWRWLSLLIAQTTLTCAFLLGVITVTARTGAQIFKGSSIASLTALSDEGRRYLGEPGNIRAMNQRARRINVKLEQGSAGHGHVLTMARTNLLAGWEVRPPWSSAASTVAYREEGSQMGEEGGGQPGGYEPT